MSPKNGAKRFTSTVVKGSGGRVYIPVTFDPSELWGEKSKHRVSGTVNGLGFRGTIEPIGDDLGMALGPAWRRDCGVEVGEKVTVEMAPEGPQRDDLAPDVAAALKASPKAGEFFDSLAQFYRKGYLRWIDSTKRSPEMRAARIAEMVQLLEKGRKERG